MSEAYSRRGSGASSFGDYSGHLGAAHILPFRTPVPILQPWGMWTTDCAKLSSSSLWLPLASSFEVAAFSGDSQHPAAGKCTSVKIPVPHVGQAVGPPPLLCPPWGG